MKQLLLKTFCSTALLASVNLSYATYTTTDAHCNLCMQQGMGTNADGSCDMPTLDKATGDYPNLSSDLKQSPSATDQPDAMYQYNVALDTSDTPFYEFSTQRQLALLKTIPYVSAHLDDDHPLIDGGVNFTTDYNTPVLAGSPSAFKSFNFTARLDDGFLYSGEAYCVAKAHND